MAPNDYDKADYFEVRKLLETHGSVRPDKKVPEGRIYIEDGAGELLFDCDAKDMDALRQKIKEAEEILRVRGFAPIER